MVRGKQKDMLFHYSEVVAVAEVNHVDLLLSVLKFQVHCSITVARLMTSSAPINPRASHKIAGGKKGKASLL
jgi:hypothetical protein